MVGCWLARLWRALQELSLAPLHLQGLGETATTTDSVFTTASELKVLVRSRKTGSSAHRAPRIIGLQQRRQQGGAIGENCPLGRIQHGLGGGGQLGGIDTVGLQGAVDQQLPLGLMDGVEAAVAERWPARRARPGPG